MAVSSAPDTISAVHSWLHQRRAATTFEVIRQPLAELDRWHFESGTGNLGHDTGRFFRVEGLAVRTGTGPVRSWSQPIIYQPEVGILGILVKRAHGTLHLLLQAKLEPGNINGPQLSPTVQATRSNYERAHGGSGTPYLEHFLTPGRGRVIVDVLQSEQGARFYRKRNRNMVVEVGDDVVAAADFRWLPLTEVRELLQSASLVNMDARTVLSCLPADVELAAPSSSTGSGPAADFTAGLRDSMCPSGRAAHSDHEVRNWLARLRRRHILDARRVPLAAVRRWRHDGGEIRHANLRHFSVIGTAVRAGNREVTAWMQPMLRPSGEGVVAALAQRRNGLVHVLVRGKVEAGNAGVVQVAPTVHCIPANYDESDRPRFLDYVGAAAPGRVRFDTLLSEEGGRFYHEQNRHLVIEADDVPADVPDDYLWVTLAQLKAMVADGGVLSIQARSILCCLCSML